MTTTLDTVRWVAASVASALPNDVMDEFYVALTLNTALAVGQAVYFPVEQYCAAGTSTNWTLIPAPGQASPSTPAPSVRIVGVADSVDIDAWRTSDTLSVIAIALAGVFGIALVVVLCRPPRAVRAAAASAP